MYSALRRKERWLAKAGAALLIGVVSGLACVAARLSFNTLQWVFCGHGGMLPMAAAALPGWRRVLVPVAGGVCAWIVGRARSGPARDYLQAVREGDGVVPLRSTVWRTVGSAFSVATGAAIGR